MTQDLKTQVLDYVNQLREQYDIGDPLTELPAGIPCDASGCVVARALGAVEVCPFYIEHEAFIDDTEHMVTPPQYVAEFIDGFDAGRYPELIEA